MKAKGKPSEVFINPDKYDDKKNRRLLEKQQHISKKPSTLYTTPEPKCFR